MTDQLPQSTCLDCGAQLPADSQKALCPACLLHQSPASRTNVEGNEINSPNPHPAPSRRFSLAALVGVCLALLCFVAAALFLLSYFSFSPLRVERRSNPSSSVQSPTSAAPPSSAVTVSEAGEPKADDSSPKPTVPAASASAVDFSSILEPPDIIPSSAPASDGSRPAVSAAETWLEEIDGGKYAQSWKDAAAFFQSVVSEENWKSALVTFRSPLGKAEVRKLRAARIVKSLPGAPDGNYVVMQFKTSFAAKKAAFETVTFMRGSDGQWRAAGYFIR